MDVWKLDLFGVYTFVIMILVMFFLSPLSPLFRALNYFGWQIHWAFHIITMLVIFIATFIYTLVIRNRCFDKHKVRMTVSRRDKWLHYLFQSDFKFVKDEYTAVFILRNNLSSIISLSIDMYKPGDNHPTLSKRADLTDIKRMIIGNLIDKLDRPRGEISIGRTLVDIAIIEKDYECLALILEYGADVTLPNPEGLTPLSSAYHRDDTKAFEILCKTGPVNYRHNGLTPLLWLFKEGYKIRKGKDLYEYVKILVENRPECDINARDETSYTALLYAANHNMTKMAVLLCKHGADVTMTNEFHQGPKYLATESTVSNTDKDLIHFLEEELKIQMEIKSNSPLKKFMYLLPQVKSFIHSDNDLSNKDKCEINNSFNDLEVQLITLFGKTKISEMQIRNRFNDPHVTLVNGMDPTSIVEYLQQHNGGNMKMPKQIMFYGNRQASPMDEVLEADEQHRFTELHE